MGTLANSDCNVVTFKETSSLVFINTFAYLFSSFQAPNIFSVTGIFPAKVPKQKKFFIFFLLLFAPVCTLASKRRLFGVGHKLI